MTAVRYINLAVILSGWYVSMRTRELIQLVRR